jgi:hypothetical protein
VNLRVEADTDSTVKVIWSVPSEGTPDRFSVSFKAVGETTYSLVAETTGNIVIHDPAGTTGWYRVDAHYGSEVSSGQTNPSTVPVRSDTVALAELNSAGNSGYGWDQTGRARTWSMSSIGSSEYADFYITDFKPASSNQQPYSIASPDMGPSDPGGVVPTDSWRITGITDPLADENAPLPVYSEQTYFNYTDIAAVPLLVGCRTTDGHYALVKFVAVDPVNGWVRVETWFQTVPELRLIRH